MDVAVKPGLFSGSGSPLRPRQDARTDGIFGTESPQQVMTGANPTTKCCRRAAPNDFEKPGNFKKDVKIEGTNSASPLESTKVSKNELKMGPKVCPKMRFEHAKEPK
jgi:hypothetical protein